MIGSPNTSEISLGFAALTLWSSLVSTLLELAAFHDNKPGPWLDDLEERFVKVVKTADASPNTPDEAELAGMESAIRMITAAVEEVRARLRGEPAKRTSFEL